MEILQGVWYKINQIMDKNTIMCVSRYIPREFDYIPREFDYIFRRSRMFIMKYIQPNSYNLTITIRESDLFLYMEKTISLKKDSTLESFLCKKKERYEKT